MGIHEGFNLRNEYNKKQKDEDMFVKLKNLILINYENK